LKGRWQFSKTLDLEGQSPYFIGKIEARPFMIGDFRFEDFEANALLSYKTLLFKQVRVNDRAGSFMAEKITFSRGQDSLWKLSISSANATDFRPSLMEKINASPQSPKPLLIRQFQLDHLDGDVKNPQSLVGKGFLSFSNSSKDHMQNGLFAIPPE